MSDTILVRLKRAAFTGVFNLQDKWIPDIVRYYCLVVKRILLTIKTAPADM